MINEIGVCLAIASVGITAGLIFGIILIRVLEWLAK